MLTSEFPEFADEIPSGFVIATVEISPGVFRLRRVPPQFIGAHGVPGPQGIPGPVIPPVPPVFQQLIPIGDEVTVITAGVIATFRMPSAVTLLVVRASLTTTSSLGDVTVDIKQSGVSILSTLITIDQGETTSVTATVPSVISDPLLLDDAEITIDLTAAGTGAVGLKVWLLGLF